AKDIVIAAAEYRGCHGLLGCIVLQKPCRAFHAVDRIEAAHEYLIGDHAHRKGCPKVQHEIDPARSIIIDPLSWLDTFEPDPDTSQNLLELVAILRCVQASIGGHRLGICYELMNRRLIAADTRRLPRQR